MSALTFRINSPAVAHETFEDEVIMINLVSGTYYNLNKTGVVIWDLLEAEATVEEIVAGIAARYETDGTDIEAAVKEFLEELRKEDLIVPGDEEPTRPPNDVRSKRNIGGRERSAPFEPPILTKYTDMQELLLLDPIHDVDDAGWPRSKPGAAPV